MEKRNVTALVSAALGALAGAVAYAAAGTLRALLSPGVEAPSPGDGMIGGVLVLGAALFWALLGAAALVLPAALLLRFAPAPRPAPAAATAGLLVFAVLLAFAGRAVDSTLLAASTACGVWTGLRQLERRLAPR